VFWGWHESRCHGAGTAHLVCRSYPMAEAVEDCKVNHTMSNGLAAANNQPAKTYTQNVNDLDFATGTRHSKAES